MAAPLAPSAPSALAGPAAQLVVQRSGQLTWLRRAAGQLWTLAAGSDATAPWQGSSIEVPAGSWLGIAADGTPRPLPPLSADASAAPSVDASAAPPIAWIEHPRSGARFLATLHGLSGLGRTHPLAAVALALSTDLRRLYAVTDGGQLYALAAVADATADDLPVAPELVLDGLERFGAPAALAFGPAGLVLSTSRAVVGVNLRSRSVAPIVADLKAHPACAALGLGEGSPGPAVAIDHRRTLYLAGERAVVAFGYEGPFVICSCS